MVSNVFESIKYITIENFSFELLYVMFHFVIKHNMFFLKHYSNQNSKHTKTLLL